ncbi:MAG: hypothetical protein Fur0046_05550 [Cyanobacteria bacterium J069]|nr:MAG: DUF563 domain-containing protein [Cyanobacteria bacterium J069]
MNHPALDLIFQGDYDGAIAHCEAAIQTRTDPQNTQLLGLALLLQGREEAAQATWLIPLAEAEPEALEAYLSGLVDLFAQTLNHCLEASQFFAAERIARQLLELDVEQASSHYGLGLALAQLGDLDAALASWQEAIALQPTFTDAWVQQATTYQKLEQFVEAGECYAAWATQQPQNADAWAGLGLCQGKLGDWDAAVQSWRRSLSCKPDSSPVLADLSYGLLQLGQVEEALTLLQQAFWQTSDFAETYCHWDSTSPRNPAVSANAAFLTALKSASSQIAPALHQVGKLLAQNGQVDRAIALYQQSLAAAPSNLSAVLDLGSALVQTGQGQAAIALYQSALTQAPDSAELWLELGRALWKQRNLEAAIAAAHRALEINPRLAEAYRLLGLAHLATGEGAIAADHWRTLLHQQPKAVDGWCNLAAALTQTEEPAEALHCLQTALRLNSNLAPQVAQLLTHLQPLLNDSLIAEFQKTLPVDAPTGEISSTRDWVARQSSRADFVPVHPPQQMVLKPPRSLDLTPHINFRLGLLMQVPSTFVVTLPGGRFWIDPDQSSLAIFNVAGELMRDLSVEFPLLTPGHPDLLSRQHWVFSAEKLPPVEAVSGTVVALAGLSNNIYFHWMLDVLPRLKILQDSGLDLCGVDYWLVSDRHSWQRDCLHHLNIPPARILPVQDHSHIQADRLIIPSFPGAAAWPQTWVCNWLKESFLDSQNLDSTLPKRLYISRQKARDRRVINEEAVMSFLESRGFTTIYLETCAIAEQAQLFYNADIVVSPHGSGLTNLAFCRPGTQVIELFSPNYVYPCYWYLSNLIGLDYAYHLGDVPAGNFWQSLLYPLVRVEDIFVNLESLRQLLDAMMA